MATQFKKRVRDSIAGATRIALLGIGSDLRADDAAGLRVAALVRTSLSSRRPRIRTKVFMGETAPENLTGEIRRFKPSHVIIIDTVDAGKRAGSIFVFDPDEIGSAASFTTHKMPAKVLIDYLRQSVGCSAIVIGIQPKSIDFGGPVSRSVSGAVTDVARTLAEILKP